MLCIIMIHSGMLRTSNDVLLIRIQHKVRFVD